MSIETTLDKRGLRVMATLVAVQDPRVGPALDDLESILAGAAGSRRALERLASSEAFGAPFSLDPPGRNVAHDEIRARLDFARAALEVVG